MADIRLHHLALGVAHLADAPALLVGELGGVPESGGPGAGFRWACWRYAGGGRIEAIEPRGTDGFLHRFLAQRGPGVHHVTFTVPELRPACDRAEAHGYRVVGYDDSDPGWQTAYLHPKAAHGIVVQLGRSSGKGSPRPWAVPAGPPEQPPAVTVLGLRLRAWSAERVRSLWATVLLGEAAEGEDGALRFRWPDCPMGLVVEIDPAGPEGPVCVEVASERPLALPPGPVPALGAVFVRRGAP